MNGPPKKKKKKNFESYGFLNKKKSRHKTQSTLFKRGKVVVLCNLIENRLSLCTWKRFGRHTKKRGQEVKLQFFSSVNRFVVRADVSCVRACSFENLYAAIKYTSFAGDVWWFRSNRFRALSRCSVRNKTRSVEKTSVQYATLQWFRSRKYFVQSKKNILRKYFVKYFVTNVKGRRKKKKKKK